MSLNSSPPAMATSPSDARFERGALRIGVGPVFLDAHRRTPLAAMAEQRGDLRVDRGIVDHLDVIDVLRLEQEEARRPVRGARAGEEVRVARRDDARR